MPEENQNSNDELGLEAIGAEGDDSAENTDEEQDNNSESADDDSSNDDDSLDFLDEKDEKEVQRQKTLEGQIKSAQREIDAGKKTLADFPDYLQENLKAPKQQTGRAKKQVIDEDALIDKAVSRIREEQKFETLKNEIKSLDLTSQQVKDLQAEYSSFRQEGLTQTKALEIAIRLAGVSLDKEALETAKRYNGMSLTPQGKPFKARKEKTLADKSDDEFLEESNKLASKESGFIN